MVTPQCFPVCLETCDERKIAGNQETRPGMWNVHIKHRKMTQKCSRTDLNLRLNAQIGQYGGQIGTFFKSQVQIKELKRITM